ncbi:CoA pyrophosphatase [Streptomyces cavourensis]|nr:MULTISPECIES: CoA pyrophosphatase [Streptomyces]MDI7785680.1 CoA pyrophosphatase [Streptomyces cavourensis]
MTHTHTQTDAHADTRTPGNGMSENRPPGNRPPDARPPDARPSVTRADDTRTAVNRPAADHPPTDRTAGERPAADRTPTERAAADRAAATADPTAVDVTTAGLPAWLDPVAEAARSVRPHQLSRFLPPESGAGRQSAVLVLFGEGARGPELLLMERSGTLRSHAGQPSFPGGALDPEDGDQATTGPLRAALREAEEETGLDPRGVQLFGVLPRLYIPVSSFVVTPVLGWWRAPSPVGVVDPAETARVFTVPVADLTDPANRAMAVHPSGHSGPAFLVESALVWGFTAGVIDRILHYAGWERPWDRARQVPLDWRA